MPECHKFHADARPFVISPYVEGDDGTLVALLPSEGPCREVDEAACRLWLDHHRHRKTGPEFPLAVLRCGAHGRRAFTVYPPGYVPYGRQRMAPVAADGSPVSVEGTGPVTAYEGTVFAAALDAAGGRAWSRDGGGPWWSVQGRWLARLVRWVGVAVELDDELRSAVAAVLGIAQLLLLDAARHIAANAGYRAQGRAVVCVLAQLRRDGSIADRLVAAGAEAGLWRHALRWHPRTNQLRPTATGVRSGRSPPPT